MASMFMHPQIHLEIARQRYQELLAKAERRALARAVDEARPRRAVSHTHARQEVASLS